MTERLGFIDFDLHSGLSVYIEKLYRLQSMYPSVHILCGEDVQGDKNLATLETCTHVPFPGALLIFLQLLLIKFLMWCYKSDMFYWTLLRLILFF